MPMASNIRRSSPRNIIAGRSAGSAPDTIRQGIRLGLPFLPVAAAADVIDEVWEIGAQYSLALATALQAEPPDPAAPPLPKTGVDPQSLAGRFSAALDARIDAAFQIAEERYETFAKTLAAALAIAMALSFNHGLGDAIMVAALSLVPCAWASA